MRMTITRFATESTSSISLKLIITMPTPTIWIHTSLFAQNCWHFCAPAFKCSGIRLKTLAKAAKMIRYAKFGMDTPATDGRIFFAKSCARMKKPPVKKMPAPRSSMVTLTVSFFSVSTFFAALRTNSPLPDNFGTRMPTVCKIAANATDTILPTARIASAKERYPAGSSPVTSA